jgi:hypothetical protein
MTFLVLASAADQTAVNVATLLRRRHGGHRVDVRTPDEIVLAPLWEHRVDDARVRTHVRMHDQGTLGKPSVVFNRISQLGAFPLQQSTAAEREYAYAEMAALLLSWLSGLECPVINRPSPTGLAGCINRPLVWQKLAKEAGLRAANVFITTSTRRFPVPSQLQRVPQLSFQAPHASQIVRINQFGWYSDSAESNGDSIFVVGGEAIGNGSPSTLAGARQLAKLSGLDVMEVCFSTGAGAPDGPSFIGANACPQVTDPMIVAAIADLLEAKAGSWSTEQ